MKYKTMKQLLMPLIVIFLSASSYNGQNVVEKTNDIAIIDGERKILLSDLRVLDAIGEKLNAPLADAFAKAEIADAAWSIDSDWAKELLRKAYELSFPDEDERSKLRKRPTGAPPVMPTLRERASGNIRNHVLEIASRDKAFAAQLAQLGATQLGKYEEHLRYASLAANSLGAGDKDTASSYLLQSIDADPTQIAAASVIRNLAAQDRLAADKLILQYIERLRAMPISLENQSLGRTYFILSDLVFPRPDAQRQSSPPGQAVMKSYISYITENLRDLEQLQPGSLVQARPILLSIWPLLKKHAPELTANYFELERLSRKPGDDTTLPNKPANETSRDNYEKRVKEALDSDKPDDLTINFALSRGDFDRVRKLIDKLPDSAQKTQFIEDVNTREAISLATKGDTLGAESLAEKLNKAVSMLQVYPLIINKCAAKKDNQCATVAFYQALRQLKNADVTPNTAPAGIPASVMATSKEFDPVLSSLGKLVKTVAPVSDEFAFQALDEMVQAANRSEVDTAQGRTGFEADVFKMLAAKNELRTQQAALNLKDELRQIVARASIAQWKAKELADKAKAIEKRKAEANKATAGR